MPMHEPLKLESTMNYTIVYDGATCSISHPELSHPTAGACRSAGAPNNVDNDRIAYG